MAHGKLPSVLKGHLGEGRLWECEAKPGLTRGEPEASPVDGVLGSFGD